MECEIKNCSKKVSCKKRNLCAIHYRRLCKHGDVYADVPFQFQYGGYKLSLAVRRKVLQAKPGYRYCQHCKKYKKAEEFISIYKCNICHKFRARNIWLGNYGINSNDYNKRLKKQKGQCALCGTKNLAAKRNSFVLTTITKQVK